MAELTNTSSNSPEEGFNHRAEKLDKNKDMLVLAKVLPLDSAKHDPAMSPEQGLETNMNNTLLMVPAGPATESPSQLDCTSGVTMKVSQRESDDSSDVEDCLSQLNKCRDVPSPSIVLSKGIDLSPSLLGLVAPTSCLQQIESSNPAISPATQSPLPFELSLNYHKAISSSDEAEMHKSEAPVPTQVTLQPAIPTKNPYSLPSRRTLPEESRNNLTYSKALMPPNVVASTTGSAPECGVVVERINGVSLETYAWAISEVTGRSSISFIGRDPRDEDYVLVFVKNADMVENLVNKGIWIRGRWLNVSCFQQPAARITVSNVLPFIPDSLIIEACEPFGTSVYPVLRKIPASVRSQVFKGAFSFRREIYLIRKNRDTIIPESITISFLGTHYALELTNQGPKCFACGSTLHTFRNCDFHPPQSDNQDGASHTPIAGSVSTAPMLSQHSSTKDKMDNNSKIKNQPQLPIVTGTQDLTKPKSTRTFFTQCNVGGLPALPNQPRQVNIETKAILAQDNTGKPNKLSQSTNKVSTPPFPKKQVVNSRPKDRPYKTAIPKAGMQTLKPGSVDEHINDGVVAKKQKKYNQSPSDTSPPSEITVIMEIDNHEELLEPPSEPTGLTCGLDSSVEVITLPLLVEEESQTPLLTHITQLPTKKTENSLRPILKQSSNSEKDVNENVKILDDWLNKSKKLKIFSRKKLTAQFLVSYPNMESVAKSALTRLDLYPNGSFRKKKAFELLEDITQLSGSPKLLGHQKRKQKMVELS